MPAYYQRDPTVGQRRISFQTLIGIAFVDAVNRRSLNRELYEGVEKTVIDLYSAVRDAYLQKRKAEIKE